MNKEWKILNQERVFDTPWRGMDKYHVQLPSGAEKDFFLTVAGDVSMIFALTEDDRVVVNRHYLFLHNRRDYELPAGFVEGGDPLQTAKQELLEETGYKAKTYTHIGSTRFERWNTATIHFYLAEGAKKVGEQTLEDDEDIEIELVPLDSFRELLRENRFPGSPSVACSYMALDYLNKV
jgi:8-oxo-dGTP pyrophosphatase MutT (NUDIX family)